MSATTVAIWLTAIATRLPGPWYPPGEAPETPAKRTDRVALIAHAVADVTQPPETHVGAIPPASWDGWTHRDRALAVLVKIWNESARFSLDVHSGKRRGDSGASVCLAQIHRGGWIDAELWRSLPGTSLEATTRCVRVAYAILGASLERCTSSRTASRWALARAYALYGTGKTCSPVGRPWAQQRATMWAMLRRTPWPLSSD